LRDVLENVLALEELIAKCRDAINQCPGMGEPVWADESQIDRIVASCCLALARINKRLASEEIQGVEDPIARMAAKGGAHPVTSDLLITIRSRDMEKFSHCAAKVQELEKQRQHLQKMDENLSNLRRLLPQFTQSLEQTCNEPYWEERVLRIGDAWHWAQARYWIEDYIRQEDGPALVKRAKQIEDEINSIISKLASLHAWSFCFSRLKEDHRRHMEAWQQSMRRLGKGTGKHAPRHRREAQGHLNACREAVPAWVMPLHRVWDTVYPAPAMFDVIIVDEASQCGVEALPLFYLGKKILIVGDDKQISPDAVGLPRDSVHRLMEEFLHDFHFKSSFDIESSLFDHGKLRYGTRRITLREHFRCMPEIIRFSNDLCYSDTPLIPLRQYGPNRLPPLEHVFLSVGYREGSNNRTINRPEAEAVVERIAEMCDDSRYNDRTMGVVVLQGEAQAQLIENQLLERLGAEEMERRRLVCGNPYSFQGDERDIMFLSLVAASNERIGPLTKAADERRFNVAASRARDMMILFHSVTCDDLSVHDLRRKLIGFFEYTKPQQIAGIERNELERRAVQDNRRVVNPLAPFDSWFEVDVALELLRKNFTVLAQYEVAGKQIDLVIEGGQARLAVECDGDNWHGADRYEADMQRQRQLERCGWEFFRVRESAFYSNKENALAGLWQALEDRGIFARARCENVTPEDHSEEDNFNEYDDDTAEDDEDYSSADSENDGSPSVRQVGEIASVEIQNAILFALAKCPNQSCTLQSLTSRVLKVVGVLTREKPRLEFERRVMRSVDSLEKRGQIEKYKAKNRRIRLINETT
jgi:very-short-patch-repair endonuclease